MRYLVLLFGCFYNSLVFGNAHYQIEVYATDTALHGDSSFAGKVTIEWEKNSQETCIYLPFNDRNFFWDPSQNVSSDADKNRNFRPVYGGIQITSSSVPYETISSYLIKIAPASKQVVFDFNFTLPQWVDSGKEQHLFHRFYPQKLERCPQSDENSFQYIVAPSHFKAAVHYPRAWYLATPAFHDGVNLEYSGRFLVFNLSLNYQVEYMKVGSLPVTVVFKSKPFPRYKYHLKQFLTKLELMLGPYPFERLVLLESEELERQAIPGVISINRPKQIGMDSIQGRYLNWTLWQLAYFSCQQWIGANLWAKNHDHQWFFRGLAEFYANLILAENPRLHNIIASTKDEKPWLEFNYRQSADLLASILSIFSPHNRLVDSSLEISRPFAEQNNFDYIRHYMLLRFFHWYLGAEFLNKLGDYYHTYKGQAVDHISFLHFMMGAFPKNKRAITRYIQMWWSQSNWPDFDLSHYKIKKVDSQKYQVTLEIGQPDDFRLPFDVRFSNKSQAVLRRYSESSSELEVTLDFKPSKIEINPNREIFDSNRFNNTNSWTKVVFFPGNAKTLRDDAYTAIWFPFVSKLPGEGVSVILGTQLFRYVNSGLTLMLSYVPSEERLGFNSSYVAKLESLGGIGNFSLAQDYGPGLRDQRVIDFYYSHPLESFVNPAISLGVRLRHRGAVSTGEGHNTWAVLSEVESSGNDSCGYRLLGVHEKTIETRDFEYTRSYGILGGRCQSAKGVISVRSFWGAVKQRREPPDFVAFGPQTLDEAKIRIDAPQLAPSRRLWTASVDIEIPAHLPISSSFFLMPKKSTWRVYYDFGEAQDPDNEYEAYGAGIRIPLGGDVVGKRSLALANFSLLAVLGKKYDNNYDRKPGFLIDFLGKL